MPKSQPTQTDMLRAQQKLVSIILHSRAQIFELQEHGALELDVRDRITLLASDVIAHTLSWAVDADTGSWEQGIKELERRLREVLQEARRGCSA